MGNGAMVTNELSEHTRLTTTARGRMLASFRQCRTALLRFATLASGARIPPIAPGHGMERTSRHRSLLQNR